MNLLQYEFKDEMMGREIFCSSATTEVRASCKGALGDLNSPFLLLPGPRPTLSDNGSQRITLPQSFSLPSYKKGQAISPSRVPP